jgi:hypothetical protein
VPELALRAGSGEWRAGDTELMYAPLAGEEEPPRTQVVAPLSQCPLLSHCAYSYLGTTTQCQPTCHRTASRLPHGGATTSRGSRRSAHGYARRGEP